MQLCCLVVLRRRRRRRHGHGLSLLQGHRVTEPQVEGGQAARRRRVAQDHTGDRVGEVAPQEQVSGGTGGRGWSGERWG